MKTKVEAAQPLYERALRIREETLGPDHPDVAMTLNHLADLHRHLGDEAKAEELHGRANAIREEAASSGAD